MTDKPENMKEKAANARRMSLLHFAKQELVAKGYHQASLNEVCRLSGGSKATIVKYYGNKAGLFAAVLAKEAGEFSSSLELDVTALVASDLRQNLETLAQRLLAFYLTPEAMALYRGVVGSGHADPALSEGFYRHGHMVIVDAVGRILKRWLEEGSPIDRDLDVIADHFTHFLRAGLYERHLLGLSVSEPSRTEILQVARRAAALFAKALRGE